MKITFVLRYNGLSGGTRVAATYAGELARRGHDITVLSRSLKPSSAAQKLRSWLWRAPRRERPGGGHIDGRGLDHRVIPIDRPLTDEDVPDGDVVIANWWGAAEWVWMLGAEKGSKVHFVQDFVTSTATVDRKKAILRLPLAKIAVSRWVGEQVERCCGTMPVVVPNGIDVTQFDAAPRRKNPIPTVGLMHSTSPVKGTGMALSAVRLAREEISDLQLIVFGQSRPRGPLKLPGNSRYFRCPDQSELAAVYAGCDAWLFASESEGFGLPVVEAMACRTPVIATPAGIAPEYCASGGGILVPFNDAQAMARAIVSVCKMSDASWREMSDAAYRTARSCTWNDACDRFEEAIKTIVESARSISACAR